MKLEISAKALKDALSTVAPAINSKHPVLVLTGVKIGGGKVIGNNNDLQIVTPLGVDFDGEFVTDHGRLASLVKGIPQSTQVTIEVDDRSATLRFGRSKYSLPIMDASTFPVMKAPDGVLIPVGTDFANAVTFAISHAGEHKSMPVLSGVCINDGRIVGTTSQILGFTSWETGDLSIIVPPDAVKAIGQTGAPKSIIADDRTICIEFDGATLTSRLMDGKYPDMGNVIPANLDGRATFTIGGSQLSGIVSRISAAGKGRAITFASDGAVFVAGAPGIDGGICCEFVSDGDMPEAFEFTCSCDLLNPAMAAHGDVGEFTIHAPAGKSAPNIIIDGGGTSQSLVFLMRPPYATFAADLISEFTGNAPAKQEAA